MKKLVLKLIQKFILESPKFQDGDLVQLRNGDEVFAVVGTYYDHNLHASLFIMDSSNRIYEVNPLEYIVCTNPEKIQYANY